MMILKTPYLLFIGDAKDPLSIKLAQGVADWRPELAVGELASVGCEVSTGINQITLEQGIKLGAETLVLGFTNSGGTIDEQWIPEIINALNMGLDIASGLHQKLSSIKSIKEAAEKNGCQLLDVRHPTQTFLTGKGIKRSGKRLLTVGTDCSVGKMYTALALEKEMLHQGLNASFKATGQCGIFIAGQGVAIDCVVSDFISGAVEFLSPENESDHWDIIEGQGSLFHPSFAGVSLGLIHGAQADALVVCHALGRNHMRGVPSFELPSLKQTIDLNLKHARLTNPDVKCAGISVNSSSLSNTEAREYCAAIEQELSLPCVDPLRDGVQSIIANL